MQVAGDPVPVATGASFTLHPQQVAASASADGTLVYLSGRSRERQLTWFDRTGRALGTVGPKGDNSGVVLSPDATMVATLRQEANDRQALWVHDIVRGSSNRVTPVGTTSGVAVWSPDSRRLLYVATTAGRGALHLRDFMTGQQEQVATLERVNQRVPTDWSRDGRHIVYAVGAADPKTRFDIWYVPAESDRVDDSAAVQLLASDAVESQGQLSPDGKWLAYAAADPAIPEIYVRPFPAAATARVWKVSIDGGAEPRWRADGKELYFAKLEGPRISLWTAAVQRSGGNELHIGTPQKLFDVPASLYIIQSNIWSYSPSPDGTRFLVNALTETSAETINVVTNWPSAVRAAVTSNRATFGSR
jgi:Tol biopolymer transport system component